MKRCQEVAKGVLGLQRVLDVHFGRIQMNKGLGQADLCGVSIANVCFERSDMINTTAIQELPTNHNQVVA